MFLANVTFNQRRRLGAKANLLSLIAFNGERETALCVLRELPSAAKVSLFSGGGVALPRFAGG
jgi:hypothetical protein